MEAKPSNQRTHTELIEYFITSHNKNSEVWTSLDDNICPHSNQSPLILGFLFFRLHDIGSPNYESVQWN